MTNAAMSATEPLVRGAELAELQTRVALWRSSRRWNGSADQPGSHRALQRGRGMDLVDSRPYNPGDDMRHMDWRATARTGKPYTKLFLAEQQRSVFLIVDRAATMAFGTRGSLKGAVAATAAAVLAFHAQSRQDLVGGLIIDPTPHALPPTRRDNAIADFLFRCAAPLPGDKPVGIGFESAIQQAANLAPKRSHVHVLSDFYQLTEAAMQGLRALSAKTLVTAVRILDPAEMELPTAGAVRLTVAAGAATTVVNTNDKKLRRRFADWSRDRLAQQDRLLAAANITVIDFTTQGDSVAQALTLL